MLVVLENDAIRLTVNSFGAEMRSIVVKQSGTEILWQGSVDNWDGVSPNLFPFIGRLKNGTYSHCGKEFKLDLHGFAYLSEFKTEKASDDEALFVLTESQKTLESYPFKFEFIIKYSLNGSKICVEYIVKNKDSKTLYFGLGGHTGFNLPSVETEAETKIDGSSIVFEKHENPDKFLFDKKEVLITGTAPYGSFKELPLTKELFNNDTILLSELKSDYADIKRSDGVNIRFWYYGCPYLALWTHRERGGFICVEPWWGLPDYFEPEKELKNKKGINELAPSKEFNYKYEIELGN